jgi:hypothetical protein
MDKTGRLSATDKQHVIDTLTKRQKRPALECELCGTNHWFIGDHLISTTVVVPGAGMMLGGPSYPFVQIICNTCGNTRMVNAFAIGLLDPAKPVQADEGGVT